MENWSGDCLKRQGKRQFKVRDQTKNAQEIELSLIKNA